jgi:hypothetical protein
MASYRKMRMVQAGLVLCGTALMLGITGLLHSQSVEPVFKYIVQFADKDLDNNPYSISRPWEFLSPKAIQRREKYQINLTADDLPVSLNYCTQLVETGLKFRYLYKSRWMNQAALITQDSTIPEVFGAMPFVRSVKRVYRNPNPGEELLDALEKKPTGIAHMQKAATSAMSISATDQRIRYGEAATQTEMISCTTRDLLVKGWLLRCWMQDLRGLT